MVLIIILSFANFFFVIDRNLVLNYNGDRRQDQTYYESYTENPIRDVVISVYMLGALGDFDSTVYRNGYDRYFAVAMFLLATFIISVVFMNMLIAIMGETFTENNEVAEQNRIREHLRFVMDHWYMQPV